jgi:hypothetical protein
MENAYLEDLETLYFVVFSVFSFMLVWLDCEYMELLVYAHAYSL